MPYTAKQNRLFHAAASSKAVAKAHGMTQAEAKRMASEGVKKPAGKAHSAPRKGK